MAPQSDSPEIVKMEAWVMVVVVVELLNPNFCVVAANGDELSAM